MSLCCASSPYAGTDSTIIFSPGGTFRSLDNKSQTEDFVLLTIWHAHPEKGRQRSLRSAEGSTGEELQEDWGVV